MHVPVLHWQFPGCGSKIFKLLIFTQKFYIIGDGGYTNNGLSMKNLIKFPS